MEYNGFDKEALRRFNKTCASLKRPTYMRLQLKKIREPQMVIVRNKFTKEVVDLEVKPFLYFCYWDIHRLTSHLSITLY